MATSDRWTIERDRATATIDSTHARGKVALHVATQDSGWAFLVPNTFKPPSSGFFGRLWVWVDAFPTKPDYAHFTLVEASGSGNQTLVRPIGGQTIPGKARGAPLWGVGSNGGASGDWIYWQSTTPAAGGRWTCMEWQARSADNSVEVWIDGVARPELSVSTKVHPNGGADFILPSFDKIRLGWQLYQGNATPNHFDVWLDDIALSTTRASCGADVHPLPVSGLQWRGTTLAGAEFGETHLPGIYASDYTYPTAVEAAYFRGKGMNLVRLPFLWERLQPSLNAEFDAPELARIASFVQQVTATGMQVLLDPHNYARYRGEVIGSAQVPAAAFADLWRRLALQFKGNNRVLFGLMNEPHDLPTEQWLAAANASLAAIRATGATNVVTVPGNSWTGAHSWLESSYGTPNGTVMKGVVDPGHNMVFEVHQYLDVDHSGTHDACVSATIGAERLAAFTGWARANHARALLGEVGAATNATCNQAVAGLLDHVQANSDVWAGWTWWAAGPWWGNYMFSIEPSGSTDKPQMNVLHPYLD